jgi:hypothetical protein
VHERVVRQLEAENLSAVMGLRTDGSAAPPRRGVCVGFDTEWDSATGALVSVQFAATVGGKVVARVYDAPAPKLSVAALVSLVARFAVDVGVALPPRGIVTVHLIAHFAGAELGQLEDALRDAEIKVLNKAHFARLPRAEACGRQWDLRIVDLYAIYKTGLKVIGEAVGLEKLELTKDEIENMAELRRRDPARFDAYAARDAEIALVAFERLRADMLFSWGVDPLVYRTIAGLALAVFRFGFLGELAPVRWRAERRGRKTVHVVENVELRMLALRSYWGGRNEAYVRGLHRGRVADLDVVSMYPFAAILQPLPNERTVWQHGNGSAPPSEPGLTTVEGFACVDFAFPKECQYPCLPSVQPGHEKLYFPLRGRSYCTIAEIRAAVALGAHVTFRHWWVFTPGDAEREHDVARYMRHFLRMKAESKPGTLPYVTNKLLLNSLIGKLAERVKNDITTRVERLGRQQGVKGLAALLASHPTVRGALKGTPRTGSAFAPEWAALILGRARAIMASIVADAGALLVSTDGIVAPAHVVLDESCEGVRALRSVGSNLECKGEGDGLWVGRERLYAVLRTASTGNWEIAKLARHGMPGSDAEAGEDILASIRDGAEATKVRRRKRLVSAVEAARRGLRINDAVIEQRQAAFKWDFKRRLLDRDVNIFTSLSATAPYVTIGGATKARTLRLCVQARNASQRRRHAGAVVDAAVHLLRKGDASLSEIAERTGTSKSWVGELRQKLLREEPLFRPIARASRRTTGAGRAPLRSGPHGTP